MSTSVTTSPFSSSLITQPSTTSVSLALDAYALRAATSYRITVAAGTEDFPSQRSLPATVLLTIGVEPLFAAISGGGIRSSSPNEAIILDASASHDPNIEPPDWHAELQFWWTCSILGSMRPCVDATGGAVLMHRSAAASVWSIPAGALPSGCLLTRTPPVSPVRSPPPPDL